MTGFDWIALGIISISLLFSFMRGAVREIFSLGAWVVAFFLARWLAPELTLYLPKAIPTEPLRWLAAFMIVGGTALVGMTVLGILLSEFLKMVGLGSMDRFLGAVFGTLRGFLAVLVLVLLAGLTDEPKKPYWKNAMFSPLFEVLATQSKGLLPDAMANKIHYE